MQCDFNVCGRAYGNPDIEAVVMRNLDDAYLYKIRVTKSTKF